MTSVSFTVRVTFDTATPGALAAGTGTGGHAARRWIKRCGQREWRRCWIACAGMVRIGMGYGGLKRFLWFLLRFSLVRHKGVRMTQGIVVRRPNNRPGLADCDDEGASNELAHAHTLSAGRAT
jgi:hypothetical protein